MPACPLRVEMTARRGTPKEALSTHDKSKQDKTKQTTAETPPEEHNDKG